MKRSGITMMLNYKDPSHSLMPHVVNVSGGRSSGMILMRLLEGGLLDASRGDVVLFNNTSAEHYATYPFLQRLTSISESYGIPFYWVEFCTYELTKKSGKTIRKPTYRIVDPHKGFKDNGDVFEEMISFRSILPQRDKRICTHYMKINVKVDFLFDWFSDIHDTPRMGHDSESPIITEDDVWREHKKYNGKMKREEIIGIKKFLMKCNHVRESQKFSDYSRIGKTHSLSDGDCQYIDIIGFRFDEQRRVKNLPNLGGNNIVYTPLYDEKITKQMVNEFWKERKDYDLELPYDTEKSNCVYCFMKGTKKLREIAQDDNGDVNSPCSIKWWQRIEKQYSRNVNNFIFGDIPVQEGAKRGFFGTYHLDNPKAAHYGNLENSPDAGLPCQCFD